MGSEKYPAENGFDAFLKKHGGSDNASTDCERTIFQFDVQRKYFREALDRWAIDQVTVILFDLWDRPIWTHAIYHLSVASSSNILLSDSSKLLKNFFPNRTMKCRMNWISLFYNRWAQFFICPLMIEDAVDREVEAVDSGKCVLQMQMI